MPSLLYIGHAYHKKTESTRFLQNILQTKYKLTEFCFDPYAEGNNAFSSLKGLHFDVVVCFQILPERSILDQNISFSKGVYFPMFDGAPNRKNPIWKEYSDFQIINFSRTLHEELVNTGLSSKYIQYFPRPKEGTGSGDLQSVFLWQRLEFININTATALFPAGNQRFHIHNAMDPQQNFVDPPLRLRSRTTVSEWFPEKDDLYKKIEESAFYIAPRHYEGIGMSFLEAMGMGRCVVAVNYPTMNEYIEDGKTGFLFELDAPSPLRYTESQIRSIQHNALGFIRNGFSRWEKEKWQILDWVEEPRHVNQDILETWFKIPEDRWGCFLFGVPMLRVHPSKNGSDFYFPAKCLPLMCVKKHGGPCVLDLCRLSIYSSK